MAERVLITGGAGFIGLHLARHLLRQGAEVTLLDDFSRGRADAELARVGTAARLVEHDLRRPIPAGRLPGSYDSVYHLAAVVGVRRATEQPARVLDVNLRAALNLLEWCRSRLPGALFLSSTSEVADGAVQLGLAGLPVGEQLPFVLPDPALPRASYALSKVVAEALFRHAAGATRVRIGRYHNIYGPRMGHDHVIPQLIERALARRDPFPVYGVDQTRSFCYVQDAVEGTVGLMRLSTPDPVVANIGNDQQEIRIGRLVELILELAGHRPAVQAHDPPPGSPPRRRPDLTALRAATGYRPRVPLAEGVRATFDWYAAAATRPGSVPPAPARGRR